MVRIEFEKTLCFKENCIYMDKENRICNLSGMNLDDSLHIGFRCGNLNNPEAKRYYFPKPEDISLKFDLIDNINKNFQDLLEIIKKEIERIKSNINDSRINEKLFNRKNIPRDHEFVFEPGFFQKYGLLNDSFISLKSKLIELLSIILPYSNDNIEFWLPLDSRLYYVSLGDIYESFYNTVVQIYIKFPQSFDVELLKIINNWRELFLSKIIEYKIIIPFKGLFFTNIISTQNNESKRRIVLPLHMTGGTIYSFSNGHQENDLNKYEFDKYIDNIAGKEKTIPIYLKPCPSYSIFKRNSPPLDSIIYSYYLTADLYCPISFRKHLKTSDIKENKFWKKLKEIYEVFLVSGIKLYLGKPYYKFPWWFSQNLVENISFAIPDWVDTSAMWQEPIEHLIPDYFIDNIGLDQSFESIDAHSGDIFFQKAQIKKKGLIFKGGQDLTYPLSKLSEIKNIYSKLLDPTFKNSFNNNQIQFLLNNLLRLAQRTSIEDIILDTCIIIESIGSSQKSKKYLILASIMSESSENFTKFFKNQYDFFDLLDEIRNKIIHGEKNKWRKKYIKFAKNLLKDESLTTIEILDSKKEIIQKKLLDILAEIIKKIIIKNIDIQNISKKGNFIELIPEK